MKLNKFIKTLIALTCLCLDVIFLCGITFYPLKESALNILIRSNIYKTIIVSLVSWSFITASIYAISYFVAMIDANLADKFERQLIKIGIILSLLIGMLTIETPEQFELVATLVSFVLIFNFFFPKDLPNTLTQIKAKLVHKWNPNKDEKHKQ